MRGEAWKTRNDRTWFEKFRTRPKPTVRKAGFKAQWTVEQLWRSPFKEERRYKTDGVRVWSEWEAISPSAGTGVKIFDEWLQYLTEGNYEAQSFCLRYPGMRTDDLDSLAFVLTGMRAQEFSMKYRAMTLDVMLRYTDLPLEEVARRAGIGSMNNLYLTCKREWGMAPTYRRAAIRKKEDIGRFR